MRDVVISIMATLAERERITTLVEKRHAGGESLRGIARSLRVSPALLIKRRKAAAASGTSDTRKYRGGHFPVPTTVSERLFYSVQLNAEYNFAPRKSLEEAVFGRSGP